jgi:hypothetical protein
MKKNKKNIEKKLVFFSIITGIFLITLLSVPSYIAQTACGETDFTDDMGTDPANWITHEINNAIIMQWLVIDSSGTGTFDPFVRVQGSPTEAGYNTNGTEEFDTKTGKWTHAIKLSDIPIVNYDSGLFREFQVDINEQTGGDNEYVSLDVIEIYLTDDPDITGYPFGSKATMVWELDEDCDRWLKLNYSLNPGSGKRDLRVLIPDSYFFGPDYCAYQAIGCDTYLVTYWQLGLHYTSDDGFEEWGVAVYDLCSKSGMKFHDLDADGVKDAGEPPLSGWTIYVDYNGDGIQNPNEPFDVTEADGTYTITGIIPGTYRVRENMSGHDDWVCSYPADEDAYGRYYEHTFEYGMDPFTGNDFGNYILGDLNISKVVYWDPLMVGDPADFYDGDLTFTVNITGPSYGTGWHHEDFILQDDGTLDREYICIEDLLPGLYNISEILPNDGWNTPVFTPGDQVVVSAGSTCDDTFVEVNNTPILGCLNITKEVWFGDLVYPTGFFDGMQFEICITGPSYPTLNCKTFPSYPTLNCKTFTYPNDLTKEWCNLIPGQYTISETDAGVNWTTTITGSPATVPAGGKAYATVNNTFKPGCLNITKEV